jgi:hypothetical protein
VDAIRWALVVSIAVGVAFAVLVVLRSALIDFPRCVQCRARLPGRSKPCHKCGAVQR